MMKYLWQIQYTDEGARGLLAGGAVARQESIREMVESAGGRVESCFFACDTHDLYVLGEVPDEAAAVLLHLQTTASGIARSTGFPLVTPEDLDDYRRKQG